MRYPAGSKLIKLSQGYETLITAEDYDIVDQYNWSVSNHYKNLYYAVSHNKEGKRIYLHRLIMNPDKGLIVDHINGNSLDNRRENLRIVTQGQNMRNTRLADNNTSGHKGVSFRKDTGKWRARVKYKNELGITIEISINTFNTIEEAILMRNKLELEHHGEYRRIK